MYRSPGPAADRQMKPTGQRGSRPLRQQQRLAIYIWRFKNRPQIAFAQTDCIKSSILVPVQH